jgi:hypothetical protein
MYVRVYILWKDMGRQGYLEGSGRDLLKCTISAFAWRD